MRKIAILLIVLCLPVIANAKTFGDFFGNFDPLPKAESGINPAEFIKWEVVHRHISGRSGNWVGICFHLVNPDKDALIKRVHAGMRINFMLGEAEMNSYSYRLNGIVMTYIWDDEAEIFKRELKGKRI